MWIGGKLSSLPAGDPRVPSGLVLLWRDESLRWASVGVETLDDVSDRRISIRNSLALQALESMED